jgi:putative flippase GtrA
MRRAPSRAFAIAPQLISMLPGWAGEVFRFLIGGVLNLIVGYGGYLVLLHWLNYELAYAISYVVAVAVSYLFSSLFVFRQPLRLRAALRYPLVYLVQFLLGLALLKLLIEALHVSAWLAPLIVSIFTIPITFLLSRIIVRAG